MYLQWVLIDDGWVFPNPMNKTICFGKLSYSELLFMRAVKASLKTFCSLSFSKSRSALWDFPVLVGLTCFPECGLCLCSLKPGKDEPEIVCGHTTWPAVLTYPKSRLSAAAVSFCSVHVGETAPQSLSNTFLYQWNVPRESELFWQCLGSFIVIVRFFYCDAKIPWPKPTREERVNMADLSHVVVHWGKPRKDFKAGTVVEAKEKQCLLLVCSLLSYIPQVVRCGPTHNGVGPSQINTN